jgi:hypothetical protein
MAKKWPNRQDFTRSLEGLHPKLQEVVLARLLGPAARGPISEAEMAFRGIMKK